MNIDFKNILQMSLANSAAGLRVMIELNVNLRFLDIKINIKFKNILQMSFANSAAALRGMIEAEGSKEKQPTGECSTCALIR